MPLLFATGQGVLDQEGKVIDGNTDLAKPVQNPVAEVVPLEVKRTNIGEVPAYDAHSPGAYERLRILFTACGFSNGLLDIPEARFLPYPPCPQSVLSYNPLPWCRCYSQDRLPPL